jgi:(p)ppGpp synthase/HD superfamily hydrolase
MKLNFIFRSIEEESSSKEASMLSVMQDDEIEFLNTCQKRMTEFEFGKIQKTLEFAKSLTSQDVAHPSIQAYINHPIRVASTTLKMLPGNAFEPTITALLHNVYEITGLTEDDLINAHYSEWVANAIRILTIDRKFQYDGEYLAPYYKSIEEYSPYLALIRCLDKLDNMFALKMIREENNRAIYLDLVEQFVVQMGTKLSPDFGEFMQQVIIYMRSTGCVPELANKYECFKQKMAEYSN